MSLALFLGVQQTVFSCTHNKRTKHAPSSTPPTCTKTTTTTNNNNNPATWDTPLVFARGAERIRALARLIALPFSRVVATPRIVTVSMLNESVGRVDVEGVLEFEARGARAWPLSLVAPARLPVHSSWCITARGEDDK